MPCGQALLPIENERELLDAGGVGDLVVDAALPGVLDEALDLPLVSVLGLELPEQERANGVVAPQEQWKTPHICSGVHTSSG